MADKPLRAIKFPDLPDTYYIPDVEISPNAEQLIGDNYVEESVPYLFREAGSSAEIGNREADMLVGGTVVWNQLCNSSSVTITNGHKYYMIKGGMKSIGASTGTAITGLTSGTDIVIDLTQMFGTTIADYIYSLEQATAGAGAEFFRKLFPKDYYEYNTGELISVSGVSAHVMRDADDNIIASYPLDDSLTLRGIPKLDENNNLYYDGDTYDHDGTVTRRYGVVDLGTLNWTKTTASSLDAGYYFQTGLSLSKVGSLNCILDKYVLLDKIGLSANVAAYGSNINKVAFRASNNNLYIIDSTYTTANDFKVAMSGVYLVYELAMPITETADAYPEYQVVDKYGTEEYVSTSIVPVGHVTKYYENLTQKIERLPKDFSTLIAPVEETTTATQNYSAGDYLILNNQLYKVTASITAGETITAGTNVTATTIMQEILALG